MIKLIDEKNNPHRLLQPMRPGGAVLVHAISCLGKSTLAARQPDRVLDADTFLEAAVTEAFPHIPDLRARLRAWRALCQRRPWEHGGDDLTLWARTRRAFCEPLVEAMRSAQHPLVLTSLRHPPWHVSAYVGVTRGRYLEHVQATARVADNSHSEAMNDRLEGYAPLVRVTPGTFLEDVVRFG